MVAAGEHIQPEGEKIFGDRGSDAESSRRVLRIGNRQVDLIRLDDVFHVVRHNTPSGRAENIADKEDLHRAFTLTRCSFVGQIVNLRPIGNRPRGKPGTDMNFRRLMPEIRCLSSVYPRGAARAHRQNSGSIRLPSSGLSTGPV